MKMVKCTNEVKEDEDLGKVFEFGDQKGICELAANPLPSAQYNQHLSFKCNPSIKFQVLSRFSMQGSLRFDSILLAQYHHLHILCPQSMICIHQTTYSSSPREYYKSTPGYSRSGLPTSFLSPLSTDAICLHATVAQVPLTFLHNIPNLFLFQDLTQEYHSLNLVQPLSRV